jgi:bile acid-coenzyme A ligase
MSIGRMVHLLAEKDPDRPAVTHEASTITRRQLDLSTNRLARVYRDLGVEQDDFVTIALPNGIAFYEAAIAIWKLGATPQPVSARLPFLERDAIIELADPSLVVGVERGEHGDRQALPVGYEADPSISDEPLPDRTAKHYKAMTSGGSTGRPKLIVSANAGEMDGEIESPMEMVADRAHLVPGPLYHNAPFAFSMGGLLRGNHVVVMTRFDAAEALRLIERYRVDYVVFVPTMMHRIYRLSPEQRDSFDLSSLRVMLHMAAPCPAWLKESWIEWLGADRIFELYGGTEAQGATWIVGDEWLEHRGSVGRPMEGSRMRILGEEGEELAAGEVGEVFIMPDEGPGSTYHYLGADARVRDGWESLGDIGWMDEDGYLYLHDRQTDMILSGGANIYPAEIEAALEAHPQVRSSAVIGLPDEDLGQRVHGIVQAEGELSEDELREHLAERLVRYKVPRSFEYVDEPLRDDAGKVRRSALLAERVAAGEK